MGSNVRLSPIAGVWLQLHVRNGLAVLRRHHGVLGNHRHSVRLLLLQGQFLLLVSAITQHIKISIIFTPHHFRLIACFTRGPMETNGMVWFDWICR